MTVVPPDGADDALSELAEPSPATSLLSSSQHSLFEDAYALIVGTMMLSLGLVLLSSAGLVTGGVAGLSLVLSYRTGLPVGLFFVALTVPPVLLTARTMGHAFAVRTLLVTVGIFASTMVTPYALEIARVDRAFAAIVGGSVTGMGALSLARHGAGSGGSGAVILWLYRTRGWNAGRTQLVVDSVVLLVSLLAIGPVRALWSLLALLATAAILFVWHRPGRYTGVPRGRRKR